MTANNNLCEEETRLIPRNRVRLKKGNVPQLLYKFPTFCEARMFITVFTKAGNLSVLWATSIQSTPPLISWRSTLILSSHTSLGLQSGLFPSGFPINNLYFPSSHPYMQHAQPISLPFINFINCKMFCQHHQFPVTSVVLADKPKCLSFKATSVGRTLQISATSADRKRQSIALETYLITECWI
jgi:hypothetical protein